MGKRILFLDYARTIALFLVVFAHLYSVDSNVKLYIYAFHMPFFFLASGYLHKEENYKYLVKKLTKRLLVPFCVFLFIGYVFYAVSSRSLSIGTAIGTFKGIILGKSISSNDILWFLLVLFQVRIMGNVFIKNPFPSSLLFCVLFVFFNALHINFLYFGTALMALPFYIYGYYGKALTNRSTKNKWNILFAFLFFCLTLLISSYNGKVSMMGMSYGNFDIVGIRIILFYINGIVGSYMILCLVGGIKKESRWLLLPSKCAITIVGLQVIPIMIWYKTIGFNQNFLFSFAYTILIIFICVCFHLFIGKKVPCIVGGK